jgi:hypothetical protein
MDPISAIFVMTVLGGLFVKGVDVATDGWFSAEVGAGVRGAAGYAVRAERARWGRAREKAREIRQQTPQGQAVQEMLDLAGLFGRTLFGELRRFGSGARSEWRTARDQARSARTGRRGDAPWPIVRAARSGAVRVREWAERRARSGADVPNEREPNGPNDPNASAPTPPDLRGPVSPVLAWQEIPHETVDDREEGAEGGPIGPTEYDGPDAYLPPRPGDTTRQPVRVEIYRAYVERGQRDVRARVRRLDAGASYHAVKGHGARSGERGWTTFHDTGWLPIDGRRRRRGQGDRAGRPRPDAGAVPDRVVHRRRADRSTRQPTGRWESERPERRPERAPALNRPGRERRRAVRLLRPVPQAAPAGRALPELPHPRPRPERTTPHHPERPRSREEPSMDINSAPAAITAWEAFAPRWESLQSRTDALQGEMDSLKNEADALHGEVATLADGMGDFAIGGEADTAASVGELSEAATSAKEQADNLATSIATAKQAVDGYVDGLHLEYDASIEAAAGKVADAHSVMQEA